MPDERAPDLGLFLDILDKLEALAFHRVLGPSVGRRGDRVLAVCPGCCSRTSSARLVRRAPSLFSLGAHPGVVWDDETVAIGPTPDWF